MIWRRQDIGFMFPGTWTWQVLYILEPVVAKSPAFQWFQRLKLLDFLWDRLVSFKKHSDLGWADLLLSVKRAAAGVINEIMVMYSLVGQVFGMYWFSGWSAAWNILQFSRLTKSLDSSSLCVCPKRLKLLGRKKNTLQRTVNKWKELFWNAEIRL